MGFKRKTSKRSIPVIVVAVVIVAVCTTTFLAFAISRNRSVIENQVTVANSGVMLLRKTGRQILGGISLTVTMVGIITNMFLIQSRR